MNGINLELEKKITKLDDDQRDVLLNLLSLLDNAKNKSEKKEVELKFRHMIEHAVSEKE